MQILIYGYGNLGRQDDGLGILLSQKLEAWVKKEGFSGFTFENNYQLNIEDAAEIANKDLVIFADASEEEIDDFCLSVVDGKKELSFTTHAASPSYIVKLCNDLFDRQPLVLLVHIKGYEWAFREGLSEKAEKNLGNAFRYLQKLLANPEDAIKSREGLKPC